jgi:hypothetical protein
MPSLAAARMAATLRARGDEVRVMEFEGDGLLALPRLGSEVDAVVLVDGDEQVRVFPASSAADIAETGSLSAADLVPDFSDYPFERTRVLPIAACTGRDARPLGAVLHEVREYARRYASPDLVFIDRELNAHHARFTGLIDSVQRHAPGLQWMAAVRVDEGESDGLSRKLLRSAAAAGLRSLVLRADGATAARRASELSAHATDAGILTRIVAAEPTVEIQRLNLVSALRGSQAPAFADIALKD